MNRLRFSCPGCAAQLSCAPGRGGQQIRCPRCGQSVLVPSLSLPSALNRWGLYLGIVGAAAGIVLAVVCSLLFLGDSPVPEPEPVTPPLAEVPVRPFPPPPPPKKPTTKEDSKTPNQPRPDHARSLRDKLNVCRLAAGLPPVASADDLNRQCRLRAETMAQEDLLPMGSNPTQVTIDEQPATQKEGLWALVVRHRGSPEQGIQDCLARLDSRLLLLQPRLKAIGLGLAQAKTGNWVTVMQAQDIGPGEQDPICYPADDQHDVPLAFAGGKEIPGGDNRKMTAGFPITVTFAPVRQVKNVQARLEDAKGNQVNIWLSTPEKPAQPFGQRNSIALIAWEALQPASTYRVQVSAEVDDKKWSRTWSFRTCPRQESDETLANTLLAKINQYRKRAGVEPVALDPSLNPGCLAHARYLVRNLHHRATLGLGAHDEDLSLPGASVEGKRAGNAAVISIEDVDPLAGLDGLLATLYHRVALLHPHLRRIGVGCAQSNRLRWTTVVDVQRGRVAGSGPNPVFFPVDGQTEVPLAFPTSGEEPDPIPEDRDGQAGFPITVTLPPEAVLRQAEGTLEEEGGNKVAAWFSAPEKPANPLFAKRQGSTVCLIPKDPLRPGTAYLVSLRGEVNGKKWHARWRFTTMAALKMAPETATAVVVKINNSRRAAGLKLVEIDPLLTQGCTAHAEYLVRHAELRAGRKLQINSEDPNLPGFSAQGLAASRHADFLFNAPTPLVQVDELLATLYRRVYLLDPALRRVGFGCAFDTGRGWVCVLDLVSGRQEETILYPAPEQKEVPCTGQEPLADKKGPVGYLITVTFPASALVKEPSLILKDSKGQSVPATLTTVPGKNTLSLVPHQPLQQHITYQVSASAQVSGRPWNQDWQFRTNGGRDP